MHRRDFLAASATVGAGLLSPVSPAAAQPAPKRGGTLIWGHSETTQNLDIHQSGTAASGRLLQNIHCALIQPDKNFRPVPALAESYEISPDLLTYTFKLRPKVKFHDGSTLRDRPEINALIRSKISEPYQNVKVIEFDHLSPDGP